MPTDTADFRLTPNPLPIWSGLTICLLVKQMGNPVPSANYHLFERAIMDRKQLVCDYEGRHRELCPIILGHTNGQEKALAYQFAGQSGSKLPEWKCLWLSKASNVRLREGPWHAGSSHSQRQSCVKEVDFDVNPASPYTQNTRF